MKRITRLIATAVVSILLWLVLYFKLLSPYIVFSNPVQSVVSAVRHTQRDAMSLTQLLHYLPV